jgi:hypothetical protein
MTTELSDPPTTNDPIDRRTTEVGEHVGAAAQGLHELAYDLRESVGGKNLFSAAADEVARRGDRLADYLRTCSTSRLLEDGERLARRAPLTVAAVGLLAGFAASRTLKMRPALEEPS